jgi:hypothetical protein
MARGFHETFGEDVTNELNFARFEAKFEQRLAPFTPFSSSPCAPRALFRTARRRFDCAL